MGMSEAGQGTTEAADMRSFGLRAWLPLAVAALIVVALIVGMPTMQDGQLTSLVAEDGPVETVTALGYAASALLVIGIWLAGAPVTVPPVSAAIILLAMGAREMDLHHTPWTMSISKIRFYTSAEVPMLEKLLAVAILAMILWSIWQFARAGLRSFVSGLTRPDPAAWAVLIAVGLVPLSKLFDGLGRNLRSLGLTAETGTLLEFNKIEELLELGIPLFVLAAIACFLVAVRNGKSASRA